MTRVYKLVHVGTLLLCGFGSHIMHAYTPHYYFVIIQNLFSVELHFFSRDNDDFRLTTMNLETKWYIFLYGKNGRIDWPFLFREILGNCVRSCRRLYLICRWNIWLKWKILLDLDFACLHSNEVSSWWRKMFRRTFWNALCVWILTNLLQDKGQKELFEQINVTFAYFCNLSNIMKGGWYYFAGHTSQPQQRICRCFCSTFI